MTPNGIHHVTAISGPARRNLAFYTEVLGLRLVKKTVNFDDPGTYHFYFGDAAGSPGTILTFFPWEHAAPGRLGIGQTQETVFRVPEGALGWWTHRFVEKGVPHDTIEKRFGESVLSFRDPDGMRLALACVPGSGTEPAWEGGDVPAEHAIRGFHGVSLLLETGEATGAILTDVFGFAPEATEGSVTRYRVAGNPVGGIVDIRAAGGFLSGREGAGSVHHIAFAVENRVKQLEVRKALLDTGFQVTPVIDRDYFWAIYFRTPGGVLFEVATNEPGFDRDEDTAHLGEALKLPTQHEHLRSKLVTHLQPLEV